MTPRIVGIALIAPAIMLACSAVTIAIDGRIVLGSNNDNQDPAKLAITPAADGLFGRICIVRDVVPGWTPFALRCMNDQGLALTLASVPEGRTPYDPDKPVFRHNFTEKIAAEAATVKQAIAMIQAYTLPERHGAFVHMMLADSSGDSAVVEWIDDEVKVHRRTGTYQVMTNSFLSKPETWLGPKSRQIRGAAVAGQAKEASATTVAAVLKEITVHAMYKGREVGTNESEAWDLTGRKIHIYYHRDFDHPLVLDLDAELAREARVTELSKLFQNPVPFETAWRAEFGPYQPK